MQGWKRRVVYVGMFELLGMMVAATVLGHLSGAGAMQSGMLSFMISTCAVSVNLFYNMLFEAWERRRQIQTRTFWHRVLHVAGFQIVLVSWLVPLIAWWLDISLWKAFLMEAVLLAFFPIFAFIYNWAFDAIFGLPNSVGVSPSQS
ncbi:PACE efflux transporter [Alcaligenes sp. MMA]|uniref:PACE efflux transporter n=1 Tax=Alcaligenes sp. MMA TaxID=2893019 RepID=UPI001E3B7638|nr:PACE efflux transporter [Alcaligenes sp. MMA]MCC9163941.1 PACE efflux transporter [Alcaligenes sp. MMA]